MTCPLDALNHELAFKPPEEALNHDGLQKELIEFLILLGSCKDCPACLVLKWI